MIDYDDVDDISFMGLFVTGPGIIVVILVTILFFYFAYSNDVECKTKSCPINTTPKLTSHSCLCVTEAK